MPLVAPARSGAPKPSRADMISHLVMVVGGWCSVGAMQPFCKWRATYSNLLVASGDREDNLFDLLHSFKSFNLHEI